MAKVEFISPEEEKIVINNMPVTIRTVDRSLKNIGDWWEALQSAERTFSPNFADLYDIYQTVRIDAFLSGIIDKRIKTVTNKKLYFKKGDKKIDECDELARMEKFKTLRKERFKKITDGRAGFEFIPGKEFDFNIIPLKHINLTEKLITKEQWGNEGFVYTDVWNIIILGSKDDFGLLLNCAPYALWKKGNMGDWAQYIEVFGQPMIIFTYDAHDVKTKAELDTIMRNIGSGTKLQVPKQVELKLEDGKQNNGDGDLQDKFRIACNQEMSVKVLGVTETTASSSSSGYAQSKEHAQQQDEVIKDDMDDELNFFNSKEFLAIQKSYGYPADGEWCYDEEVDVVRQKADIDIDTAIEKLGAPLGHDYYYEHYNRPKPANYEELIAQKEAALLASAAKQTPPNDNANTNPADKKDKKKKPTKLNAEDETIWNKFRHKLADFFDPAR